MSSEVRPDLDLVEFAGRVADRKVTVASAPDLAAVDGADVLVLLAADPTTGISSWPALVPDLPGIAEREERFEVANGLHELLGHRVPGVARLALLVPPAGSSRRPGGAQGAAIADWLPVGQGTSLRVALAPAASYDADQLSDLIRSLIARTAPTLVRDAPAMDLVVVGAPADLDAVQRAIHEGSAVSLCGALVDAPPNIARPPEMVRAVTALAATRGLAVSQWSHAELEAERFGGLVAVGSGASDGCLLVRVDYRPPGAVAVLHLVGKGVTFDTGGLCLKSRESMNLMKEDKAGAATVVSALLAIAALSLPVSVTAWLPIVENMPGPEAMRPSDVVRMWDGSHVEINNTDAEGRLMLADVLARAATEAPDLIVDVATLTGAQIAALGSEVIAAMGNDLGGMQTVLDAAVRSGERVWPMPLHDDIARSMRSTVADLSNVHRGAESPLLAAGWFLHQFVPSDVPWVHLDTCGPSYRLAAADGDRPRGGTGSGVRLLIETAASLAGGALPSDSLASRLSVDPVISRY